MSLPRGYESFDFFEKIGYFHHMIIAVLGGEDAEVAGGGLSADAYHITATHPEGLGATLVMENALRDAGMKPEDIDYINLHGTSTPVGDVSEAIAVKYGFGDHAY